MDARFAYTITDLRPGMSASHSKSINADDLTAFAALTGDTNVLHFDEAYAQTTMFQGRIVHGMLSASLLFTVLGTKLPGPGCVALGVDLRFRAPVRIGDTVTATCTVREVEAVKRRVTMDCVCTVRDRVVIEGEALVMPAARPA